MGHTVASPLFVPSMPGSLKLSSLWEGLPLWEEGRSTSLRGEVLPGFFTVSLAMVLGAGSWMTLRMMAFLFTQTAAMFPHHVAPSGLAGVAAPFPRTGLRLTAMGTSPGPGVRTLRTTLKGMTTRIHTACVGGLAAASTTSLRLVAIDVSPPRVPCGPCSGRLRLLAHPTNMALYCRHAQAWASSPGGRGRRGTRRKPEERKLAKENSIAHIGEVMDANTGGAIGVAEISLTSSYATTSMVLQVLRKEGIAVAVIDTASDSARTPIPPRPSSAVGAVGVLIWALYSISARTSTALHRWQAAGGEIGEADFFVAPGFASLSTSPRPTVPASLGTTAA